MSAAFSAIMIAEALVFPVTTVGMIEASQIRKPPRPRNFKSGVTTDIASWPILHVPTG